MGVVESSRGAIESQLSALHETYDSFSVEQTTVPVSSARYERERERIEDGLIEVSVRVRNDESEILHTAGESPELPSTTVTDVADIDDAARAAVRQATGVDCSLVGLDQVHILGVHDADRETLYRLAVTVEAVHDAGDADGVWRSTAGSWTAGVEPP
jgi:hypothetical protein